MKGLLLCVLALTTCPATATNAVIRCAADLARAVFDAEDVGRDFDLEATVTYMRSPRIAFEDRSGTMYADDKRNAAGDVRIDPGDRIRMVGRIILSEALHVPAADCRRIDLLAHGPAPKPEQATVGDATSGRLDFRLVTVRGLVADMIADQIDGRYLYVTLEDGGDRISIPVAIDTQRILPKDYGIGRTIEVTGLCNPVALGGRKLLGRVLEPVPGTGVKLLDTALRDPFNVPELGGLKRKSSDEIARLGRRRTKGTVLATWNGDSCLIQRTMDRLLRVDLAEGPLPRIGEVVEVSGFPFTDSYTPCLRRALWRPANEVPAAEETPVDTSVKALLTADGNQRRYDWKAHGHVVRIRGKALNLPSPTDTCRQFYLGDGSLALPVVLDALGHDPAGTFAVGSELEVTGVCLIETESKLPGIDLPSIRSCILVPRRTADLRVLRTPPWWTPGRLLAVIGLLGLVLGGIIAWNIALQRLAERRGREIAASDIARAEADMRTYERTRLAVELHDSISQTLTGVAMELRTADIVADADAKAMRQHLDLATRTLDSCREELRNCIWDLRSLTLEEADVNEAIRKTLVPHVGNVRLSIRFSVPRERLSDNTAHAIMRIIRELAINAVHHGQATAIKVAGSIEGDKLLFSVRDDGRGFDPTRAPGMAQGHFGIQGIRDRVTAFDGEMSIASGAGRGTKVTIALNVPNAKEGT